MTKAILNPGQYFYSEIYALYKEAVLSNKEKFARLTYCSG
jgi:hypothetical protein